MCCVLCAVCCVLCAVCCVLCAVCCVLCGRGWSMLQHDNGCQGQAGLGSLRCIIIVALYGV